MLIGIININKPSGWTSHDVVAKIRRLTNAKAGHTGTLDPAARGVLPICLGSATKIADYIMAADKEYIADIIFGAATDTLDAEGAITATAPADFDAARLEAAIAGFRGDIQQLPPMYAAIKVGGKKLYELARQGKSVERQPRQVHISKIDIIETDIPKSAKIRVACSKGTYIRSLCADIGEALGTLAHMGGLIRTRSGNFAIEDTWEIDELVKLAEKGEIARAVMPIDAIFPDYPKVQISPAGQKFLQNGNLVHIRFTDSRNPSSGENALVYDAEGKLRGMHQYMEKEGELWLRPLVML